MNARKAHHIWMEQCEAARTEPDQDQGWCESCGTNTVKSALILASLI
jgi:rRNA maturation endonuclease Nob1